MGGGVRSRTHALGNSPTHSWAIKDPPKAETQGVATTIATLQPIDSISPETLRVLINVSYKLTKMTKTAVEHRDSLKFKIFFFFVVCAAYQVRFVPKVLSVRNKVLYLCVLSVKRF